MKIKKVEFKNFVSYGNELNVFEIQENNSLNLIYGNNGSGKSTLLNVIKYALYGQVELKTLKELVNRNQKSLYVKIYFETNKSYALERGIKPDILNLYQKNENDEYELVDMGNKRNTQKYIEDEILHISYYVFSNTISLSINNFKSILRMNAKDKRDIRDKIFGLQIINKMSELVKEDIKKFKIKYNELDSIIKTLEQNIQNATLEIEKLKNNINKENENKLNNLELSLKILKNELSNLNDEYSNLNNKYNLLLDKKNEITKKETIILEKISSLKKQINLYNTGKCPLCGSDLTDNIHISTLNTYENEKLLYEGKLSQINESTAKLNNYINDFSKKLSRYNEMITNKKNEIYQIQNEIKKINNTTDNSELSSLNNIILNMKEKIKQNENEINIIEKKLNIYNILETVLGDHGIKEKILSLYIPLLNHEIKKYLNIMNINYDLEIDDEFNTKLTILGDECELTSLSTGELKKVDFAVLLSILKIIQIKQSNLNILMLDEIFSSIDGTGQNDIIEILKDISKIYNLNIYVISHYPLPTAEFDNVIHVTKDGDYSKFEFAKI